MTQHSGPVARSTALPETSVSTRQKRCPGGQATVRVKPGGTWASRTSTARGARWGRTCSTRASISFSSLRSSVGTSGATQTRSHLPRSPRSRLNESVLVRSTSSASPGSRIGRLWLLSRSRRGRCRAWRSPSTPQRQPRRVRDATCRRKRSSTCPSRHRKARGGRHRIRKDVTASPRVHGTGPGWARGFAWAKDAAPSHGRAHAGPISRSNASLSATSAGRACGSCYMPRRHR